MSDSFVAFVQARMSSTRFPGKVLAPFRGRPLLAHVVEAARAALPNVVLLTSDRPSDDPLEAYAARLSLPVFRGDLDDVLGRFASALSAHPAEWVIRLCADSPLLDPQIVRQVMRMAESSPPSTGLVTNVAPRTFARGQSVEAVRAKTLVDLSGLVVDAAAREHVTKHCYEHAGDFEILNLAAPADRDRTPRVVDTLEDLARLERDYERLRP